MKTVTLEQKTLIENILHAYQIRLNVKLVGSKDWFEPLQGILIEGVYFTTQLSLLNKARDWYVKEVHPRNSPTIKYDASKYIRNLKIGKWYTNPMHSSMSHGRIVEIDISSAFSEKYYYNTVTFDMYIKNGVIIERRARHSNGRFDELMVETSKDEIKKLIKHGTI